MNDYKAQSERTDADERALTPAFKRRQPFHPRLDVALEKMRCNIVPELSVCVIAEAYDNLVAQLWKLEDNADKLAQALRDTGHDLSEISLWLKCEESKPEAKLKSIATLIEHNQNKRRDALKAYESEAK